MSYRMSKGRSISSLAHRVPQEPHRHLFLIQRNPPSVSLEREKIKWSRLESSGQYGLCGLILIQPVSLLIRFIRSVTDPYLMRVRLDGSNVGRVLVKLTGRIKFCHRYNLKNMQLSCRSTLFVVSSHVESDN